MKDQASPQVVILTPAQLLALVSEDRERTLAEWHRRRSPRKLTTAQAAVRCGRVRPDGTANQAAFKAFLARHPDLPREKAGRRLVFDEAALDRWLAERPGQQGGDHAAA